MRSVDVEIAVAERATSRRDGESVEESYVR